MSEENTGYYYRFIYKDEEGQLGYTIVNVPRQEDELAIAEFETKNPNLVWRRFEEVQP